MLCSRQTRKTLSPKGEGSQGAEAGAAISRIAALQREKSGRDVPLGVAVGRTTERRLLGGARLAEHDIGDVGAAQAEIGEGVIVERAELGIGAVLRAPIRKAPGEARESVLEDGHWCNSWKVRRRIVRCTKNRE